MSNEFYRHDHQPQPRTKRRPGEPVWAMTKAGSTWSAELRSHAEWGWELQLFKDGGFRYGRRHPFHVEAVAEGEHWRTELEAKGWTIATEETQNEPSAPTDGQ